MLNLIAKPFIWAHHSPRVNHIFQVLDKIIAGINKNVAVAGIAAGVAITAVNVVLRYVSTFYPSVGSLTWGEEVARYCFIWSALFGAAYGFRKGIHISVTLLIERFAPPVTKGFVLFGHVISSLFLGFMVYSAACVVWLNYEMGYMSEALHAVPLFVFLLCLPLSFFGATYRSVEKIYEVAWMDAREVIRNAETEMIHDSVVKD